MATDAYPEALLPKYRLHWYVIEQVLGQGGFGITYLAQDSNLQQQVAIKEYLPLELATRCPDATVRTRTEQQQERYRSGLERFIREARTLARFDHPNIVRVHSVFEANNTAYMVMRYEEGETLGALLERRPVLMEQELSRIMGRLLEGLRLVHNAGFIHRDIKPDNIHIRPHGTPVLLDFGSARSSLGPAQTVTIMVAPGYAPFEQYSTGEDLGPWTDLYGLAATCYRAIAGRPPPDAIARSKGILANGKDPMLPAAVLGSGRYSETFLAAVDHALAFAAKDRPQSIEQWRPELLDAGVAAAKTLEPAATASVPVEKVEKVLGPATASRKLIWGTAGATAVVGALLALVWLKPHFWEATQAAAQQPPAAPTAPVPVAAEDGDALKTRVAALEQELAADRKRLADTLERAEMDRKRFEEERLRAAQVEAAAKPAPKPKPAPAPAKPASRPVTPKIATVRTEEKVAPAPQAVATPAPQPMPVIAVAQSPVPPVPQATAIPAPEPRAAPPPPPRPAELLASAERAYGRGDYSEAATVLKRLAEQENATAQRRLGELYLQGQGVERNDPEALRLIRKAATKGDSEAQVKLGEMYYRGRGVRQNTFQAYVWYSAAVRSGNSTAKAQQDQVGASLQPMEIEQAGKLAAKLVRPRQER